MNCKAKYDVPTTGDKVRPIPASQHIYGSDHIMNTHKEFELGECFCDGWFKVNAPGVIIDRFGIKVTDVTKI